MNKRVTQAVILAGGLGTRLKPFTNTNPKPMYPINNVPFIDYLVRQMKNFRNGRGATPFRISI